RASDEPAVSFFFSILLGAGAVPAYFTVPTTLPASACPTKAAPTSPVTAAISVFRMVPWSFPMMTALKALAVLVARSARGAYHTSKARSTVLLACVRSSQRNHVVFQRFDLRVRISPEDVLRSGRFRIC